MSRAFLRRAAITGLIVGVAAIHLSLVGLIASLHKVDLISKVVTIGSVIPLLLAFAGGYRAGGPMRIGEMVTPRRLLALASGALAGLAAGVLVAIFTLLVDTFNPRDVLINASPALVKILHWELDPTIGTIATLAGGAAVGLLGAGLQVLPNSMRRAGMAAIVAVFSLALMQTFVGQILTGLPLEGVNDFFYAREGMTPIGALVALLGVAILTYLWAERGHVVRARYAALSPTGQRTTKLSGGTLALLILLSLPLFIGPFLSQALDQIGLYILLGLGLNIVVGFAGLLDLGYVAFYAVGAYSTAVLTSPVSPAFNPTLNFWVAVPIVMAITAFIGLSIGAPVLRLRGDYLAIVTLGFGEIARIIFTSDWMSPYLGGAQGILQVPAPNFFGIDLRQPEKLYYPILVACVIAAIVALSLAASRVGRAWTAMREDESVAEATGINTTKYKLMAFAMGATFGGLAGALYAVRIGSVFPQDLKVDVSINVLALIILGGIGSIPGVIVGAFVLVGLPELLREFSEFRLLIYGIVLVAMMIARPEGFLPNRSRRAELHEGEEDATPNTEGGQSNAPEPMTT
jgi:branched-chain amino acid transport system permease protein